PAPRTLAARTVSGPYRPASIAASGCGMASMAGAPSRSAAEPASPMAGDTMLMASSSRWWSGAPSVELDVEALGVREGAGHRLRRRALVVAAVGLGQRGVDDAADQQRDELGDGLR